METTSREMCDGRPQKSSKTINDDMDRGENMTIKENLRLMAAIKKANDRRAQEWAARRKGQAHETK